MSLVNLARCVAGLMVLTGLVFGEGANVPSDETRTTKTGHAFRRDKSHAFFGRAWRDESDTVWSARVKGKREAPWFATHGEAKAHCKRLEGKLPSGWEPNDNDTHGGKDSDFVRLRRYMGAAESTAAGYQARVMSSLTDGEAKYYWSATNGDPDHALVFEVASGRLYQRHKEFTDFGVAVICVSLDE